MKNKNNLNTGAVIVEALKARRRRYVMYEAVQELLGQPSIGVKMGGVALYADAAIRAKILAERRVEASDEDSESDRKLELAVRALELVDSFRGKAEALSPELKDGEGNSEGQWVEKYDRNGPEGRFREIAAGPVEMSDDTYDTWLHLNTDLHNLEDKRLLRERLLSKFKTQAREVYTKAIDEGYIPESVRGRLELIDVVPVELIDPREEESTGGAHNSASVSIELRTRDSFSGRILKPRVSEKELYDTYIHELTHLLSGRLLNRSELGQQKPSLPSFEAGLESHRAPFSTNWMNEALTEHIALALVSGDMRKIDGEIICDPDTSDKYIAEREALSKILQLTGISTQEMIDAYFEDGIGYRKSHEPRKAELLMDRINRSFTVGTLGVVRRELDSTDYDGERERIEKALTEGCISGSDDSAKLAA